jgi:L-malate glycosyltransferase
MVANHVEIRAMIEPTQVLMVNSEKGWRGGEAQTLLTSDGLQKRGFQVTIACPAGTPLASRAQDVGITVINFPMSGLSLFSAASRIRHFALNHKNVIIHAQTPHAHSAAAMGLVGTTIPLIVSRRVMFPLKKSLFTKWKYARAHRVIAVSSSVAQQLEHDGVPANKITVVYDAINAQHEQANTSAKTFAYDLPQRPILCVANLSADKDHDTLLRAWSKVEAKNTAATLLLAGQGERESELKNTVNNLGLQRVQFLGFRDDIPALLDQAYAVVMTSRFEGLGSILVEAQARGIPVVATRTGGIPEAIIDGQTGLLAEVGNDHGIAENLLQLLSDTEQHQRMSVQARQHALSRFSLTTLLDRHAAIYAELLAGHK